ncbi:hypothetical protein IID62_08480 [candidate division KSB1 bacterium]|nr:hypothetical protein [candidate division KSB1 bacterium]
MKTNIFGNLYSSAILLLVTGILVSCSTFATNDAGYTLEYGIEKGKVSSYTITGYGSSTMEVQGQVMSQTESLTGTATHVVTGESSNILDHELTFTDLSLNSTSDMTGSMNISVSSIVGVALKIATGRQGEDIEFINFDDIPRVEGLIPPHLNLIELLPILAPSPVNVSDTWKGIREQNIESHDFKMILKSEIDYLFAGIEQRLGFECVKITATDNYTLSGSGIANGMNTEFYGYGTNNNTYYFAYKEGILIELDSRTGINLDITMTAMGMTIPIVGTGTLKFVYNK